MTCLILILVFTLSLLSSMRSGDNYESEVLYLLSAYQYITSAMAFNFGYEFRQAWWRNYLFVAFALFYTVIQFYITLVPGEISCVWRVNCVNENTCRGVVTYDALPIQNPFNTTVMPEQFRWKLVLLMVANAVATSGYEYFIVNGVRRYHKCTSKKAEKDAPAAAAKHIGVEDRNNPAKKAAQDGLAEAKFASLISQEEYI
jgi:hypothetical protein